MKVLVNSLQGISQVVSRYPDTPWVSPNPGIKPRSPALSLNSLPSEPRGKPTQTYMQSEWLPTPVFLLGKSRGQRSLVDYSPWGCKGLDMTEGTEHICICRCMCVYICVCVYLYIYIYTYTLCSHVKFKCISPAIFVRTIGRYIKSHTARVSYLKCKPQSQATIQIRIWRFSAFQRTPSFPFLINNFPSLIDFSSC